MGWIEPAPAFRPRPRRRFRPAGALLALSLAAAAVISIFLFSRQNREPAATGPRVPLSRTKPPRTPAASLPVPASRAAPPQAVTESPRREAVIDVRDALAISPRPALAAAAPLFGSPDFREYRFHSYQPPYRSDWLHAVTGSVYNRGEGSGTARARVTARADGRIRFDSVVQVIPASFPLPAILGEAAQNFGTVPASEYQSSDDVLSAISDINQEEAPRILFRSEGGRSAAPIPPHSEGRFHVVFECICRAESWQWNVELEE